jgi:hypothetical protein
MPTLCFTCLHLSSSIFFAHLQTIRDKCTCLYFLPFVSVSLTTMAAALDTPLPELEAQVRFSRHLSALHLLLLSWTSIMFGALAFGKNRWESS